MMVSLSDMFTLPFLLFWAIQITSCVPGHQNNVTPAIDTVSTDVFISGTPVDELIISASNPEDYLYDFEDDEFKICVKLHVNQAGSGCMGGAEYISKSEHDTINVSHIYGNVTLPQGVRAFLVRNVSCIVYNTDKLNCTWVTLDLPAGAQHSVTVTKDDTVTTYDCFTNSQGNIFGCHANIDEDVEDVTVHINVSLPNFCYIHSEVFEKADIDKLNPPHNVTASVVSDSLIIKWDVQSMLSPFCFYYQININNELFNSTEDKEYTVPNINLRQKYLIKVRVTKTPTCRVNNIWSDWSEPVEVMAAKELAVLNGLKIAVISLGIPMFLLAVVLLCRWPRIVDKLFPPIPRPSVKMKQLLEIQESFQVVQPKYTEEVTEIEDDYGN
ncbi:interleukin-5 receptor subunit alpha-like isoform X1 [Scleropages formosus]|uniref:Interleukin-5 receptor subunit alpha-like n=2 Tax=Scleropages formosus TaxID=113540 RepID=A0A8C9WE70_SCLFO|nr:interleukin-5 receptor subunit alpha-like isoform X1 [Scleropages formosus]